MKCYIHSEDKRTIAISNANSQYLLLQVNRLVFTNINNTACSMCLCPHV